MNSSRFASLKKRVLALASALALCCTVNVMADSPSLDAAAGHGTAATDTSVKHVRAATYGEFDDCAGSSWCPRMIKVPAGSFVMGSPKNEVGRFDDEGPERTVRVRAFAVGKFDVTRAQWKAFAAATHRPLVHAPCDWAPSKDPTWEDPGYPQADDHPVVCITWGDAQDYVGWLSTRTGKPYRMLSEAEWEYAARAGSTTAFPWGAAASHEFANYGADACCGLLALGRDKWLYTSPVGSFPANAFGLYDMHGNVFQWVQDCHTDSYAGLPSDGSAHDDPKCNVRVGRGGVFGDRPSQMRSAARNYAPPDDKTSIADYRSSGFGLRVARSLP